MKSIVLELTSYCNLKCIHCFEGRHSNEGHLSIDVINKIAEEAKQYEFEQISFTGGEPTIHPDFIEIIKLVVEGGYYFGFVSNGHNFPKIYPTLVPFIDRLSVITFSLDGAREETHDFLRGNGSYSTAVGGRHVDQRFRSDASGRRIGNAGTRYLHLYRFGSLGPAG